MISFKQHIRAACELAINVSIAAVKGGSTKIIPVRMFAYLGESTPSEKAYAAAIESIEENADFRRVVANYATPASVGEAGFEWLTREQGWIERFAALTGEKALESPAQLSTIGAGEIGGEGVTEEVQGMEVIPPQPPGGFEIDAAASSAKAPPARDISDELSSLRGLVDRLADERETVQRTAADPLSLTPEDAASEIDSLNNEIDTLRAELERLGSSPKDSRQLSEALSRQVQLEKELADLREIRSDLEGRLSDAEVSSRDLSDKLTRATESQSQAEMRLSETASELETLKADSTLIREEFESMKIERDEAVAQITEITELTGGIDVATLKNDNEGLSTRISQLEREAAQLKARENVIADEFDKISQEAAQLHTDKTEIAVRLTEAESDLEQTRQALADRQLQAEELTQNEQRALGEISELNEQVHDLQMSLAGALEDLAKVRAEGDSDRTAFRRMRAERDALLARVSEVEQVDQQNARLIDDFEVERQELLERQDELITERGKLKGETAAVQRERDQLSKRLEMLQEKIEPLESAMLSEKRRVEELQAALDVAQVDRGRFETDIARLRQEQLEEDVDFPALGNDLPNTDVSSESQESPMERISDELAASERSQRRHPTGKSLRSILDSVDESAEEISSSDTEPAPEAATESADGVWGEDWPPVNSEVDNESYAPKVNFVEDTDDDDVDIDEISELLSRTVTDFKPISDVDGVDNPPSVFDSTTKSWVESGETTGVDALQNLVSTPGSVLIVDGDNVAQLGWARLPIGQQRASLVTFCEHICEEFSCSAEVVFDSSIGGRNDLPTSSVLGINFAANAQADEILADLISKLPTGTQIGLISDNPGLAGLSGRGVQQFANEDLLDFISAIAS